jgi:outer membrane biosynthesis protein TonB
MNYREEENNYPKAFLLTGILLAVFFLICYIIILPPAPKQDEGTGGILVNYGTVDEGMGNDYMSTEEPSVAEKANHTKPDKVTPAPPSEEKPTPQASEKTVVTQNTEDAPEVAAPTKKPTTAVATPQPTKTVAKPVVNQNALYKGKATTGTGEGDGTGNKPGNQGKPTGTTLTNNYNGTGSGNGGNLNMAQRNFVSRPSVSDDNRQTGKIMVDIRVDKDGNVVYARAGARGTTITDAALLQKCEDAVKNSKLNALDSAPDTQQGTVVFVFKVN